MINQSQANKNVYKPNPSQEQLMELKNANIDLELKLRQFLHTTNIKPVDVNVTFLCPLEISENHNFLMF